MLEECAGFVKLTSLSVRTGMCFLISSSHGWLLSNTISSLSAVSSTGAHLIFVPCVDNTFPNSTESSSKSAAIYELMGGVVGFSFAMVIHSAGIAAISLVYSCRVAFLNGLNLGSFSLNALH